MKQRTLWQQRPHLIHLCSALFTTAPVSHTEGVQQICCELVNYCIYSESRPTLQSFCKMPLYLFLPQRDCKLPPEECPSQLVRNHLQRVTKPVSYVLLPCLLEQRAQSPGHRGHHPP